MLLQRELGVINHKRVYRLYRLGQLKLRQRKRKRVAVNPRAAVMAVTRPREAWAMDFMQDVLDNGPEFAGRALDSWAYTHHVILDFIDPGKPTQNGHLESFNGKFRDECLNLRWFTSLHHARHIIAAWKEDYNTQRPHSALHQQPPALYAQTLFA